MGFSVSASENQTGETNWPRLWVVPLSAAGYYCGAKLGFALTFEPVPISLLWPPNAILLAALLTVPRRWWWLVIIAAFPAHLAATLQSGVPKGMMLGWFISNSSQAFLGAIFICGILGQRVRFHLFRDVVVFIVFGAFLSPFASSFLDVAWVKLLNWGEGNYWELWRLRFFSNIVAVLIIVPPLLTWHSGILPGMRNASRSRQCEAVLLASGLLGVSLAALLPLQAAPSLAPLLLYAPLPFLIWATVRFDAFWASLSLLLLAFLAMRATTHGLGTFTAGPPSVNALSIQCFLISISVPLFLLSATIQERQRSVKSSRHEEDRLGLAMTATKSDDRQRYLNRWYRTVTTRLAFDIKDRILSPNTRNYRWHFVRSLRAQDETGGTTRLYGTASDTDADDEKKAEHALALMRDELEQTIADRTSELRRANDVLKTEIEERKKAKEAEQMSEARFAKVFRLSPDAMYISADIDGTILDVNERWLTLFKYNREEVIGKTARQLNLYVGDKDAAAVIERNRICGSVRELEVELRDKEAGIRQAVLSGEAINIGEEACFITIIRDVTEERRAQNEMQQQRELLTHLTRVVMLGELSGALAHELNQPLAAILTNAQAARRFMASNPVDLQEIRDILNDIIDEDKRAGEVIRRLRVLFMKGKPSLHPINCNEVVHEALDLARSDLAARKVKLSFQLSNALGIVLGDKIQLQQVILNLIVNGCEAMSDRAEGHRQLSFSTDSDLDGNVRIAVSDTGTGIPPDMICRVFDPVFTTKVHGLGFGLSISRSIITAHGGRIEASNIPEGGATFQITLPLYHGSLS